MRAIQIGKWLFNIQETGELIISTPADGMILTPAEAHSVFNLLFEYRSQILDGSKREADTPKREPHKPVKAACRRGHTLTPDNVYYRPDGYGICRACRRSKVGTR